MPWALALEAQVELNWDGVAEEGEPRRRYGPGRNNGRTKGKEMAKNKTPVTSAVRMLREAGVSFKPYLYKYEDKGGTAVASRELGRPEEEIIKTLVFEDDRGAPLLVLMHGHKQVSTRNLARALDVKAINPCDPKAAEKTHRVPGGRHIAFWDQKRTAGVRGKKHSGPASDSDQRRQARVSG